jgi:hypothetical protein
MQATTQIAKLALPPSPVWRELPMSFAGQRGVFCVHCGAPITLEVPQERLTGHVSLVWCQMCLREAPYRAEDVIGL